MSVSTAGPAVAWDWAKATAAAAEDGPGADTVIFDVGDVLGITEHFVITSGATARAVRALSERIEEAVDLAGGPKPICIEGLSEGEWVLMDYGDFVVHIFTASAREYYALDLLWKDCPILAANPLPT